MKKSPLPLIVAMFLALSLSTACAERDTGNETATQVAGNGHQGNTTGEAGSLMNQPVDFSSPEAVEATLQSIRENEGDAAYKNVKSAMDYALFYDLSIGNDKEKLYKKLDGETPNNIIAKMKR